MLILVDYQTVGYPLRRYHVTMAVNHVFPCSVSVVGILEGFFQLFSKFVDCLFSLGFLGYRYEELSTYMKLFYRFHGLFLDLRKFASNEIL